MNKQWWNLSPRVGLAWDVSGNGRTAVRSSYALNYDFAGLVFQNTAVQAAPFDNRVDLTGDLPFANPYQNVPGGQQQPVPPTPSKNSTFPGYGSYAVMDPNINSTRVQSWNATIERQIGARAQVSASYLGSHMDRLWGSLPINPGVYVPGSCTLQGTFYPVCTIAANVDQRRALSLQNPVVGQLLSNVSLYTDVGTESYRGLKLSFRHRAANGFSLSGNYTLSHCETDTQVTGTFIQFNSGYSNPKDPSYDRGNCPQNQRQIASFTVGAQSPRFMNTALRMLVSDWRAAGILSAHTGDWLTVTTGKEITGTGLPNQRVNQVNTNPYGNNTLNSYLNPAAFAYPTVGTFGNEPNWGFEGPGYWDIDLTLARLLPMGAERKLEIRIEAFNLLNHFNRGDPGTNLDAGTFGLITTQNGSSRVMQFAIKYEF
jgi:hypothetical protein